jgi:putative N6-adenine-specific DNA methylase
VYHAFAVAAPGLAPLLAAELQALGVDAPGVHPEGVSFRASERDVWRVNLWSRTASRILVRANEFHAETFYDLERRAKRVEWAQFLQAGRPVHLRVTCRKSRLYHSDAVAERVARAISAVTGAAATPVAQARAKESSSAPDPAPDRRPTLTDEPDATAESVAQLVIVRLDHDRCTISMDSSGALLHRRGYRLETAKAPLRETLAAAMLLASGWTGQAPLLDPLCGSGTLLIEAAWIARNRAPGLDRPFAFMQWPGFDQRAWQDLVAAAQSLERAAAPVGISGSDRDAGAIAAASRNAERARVRDDIVLTRHALSAVTPGPLAGWLVSNPPYGVRVGDREGLRDLYARLGQIARARCAGWTVVLVSADRALLRATKLPFTPVLRTVNGGIPVEVVKAAVSS